MFLPIAHFDLDAFFASVEQKLNPRLRDKPVIVCGVDPQGKNVNRGVVSTCSYQAREFGVKSGMPVYQARNLCPQGIFIKGNFPQYQKHSNAVFIILCKFVPHVIKTNLDEGFLDFTGCEYLYPDTPAICQYLREEIKNKVGISVSIGLANSWVLGKIACKLAKPDGLFIINNAQEQKIIYPLPIEFLPGVGPKTQVLLKTINIKTIGDIIKNKKQVMKLLGKDGVNLYLSATGIDNIWFRERNTIKSISRSMTFTKNTINTAFILSTLFKLCEEVFYELFGNNLDTKCVGVTIRYPNFQNKNISQTIHWQPLSVSQLYNKVSELLLTIWDKKTEIRLVGIKASKLQVKDNLKIFTEEEKIEKVTKSIYKLREKYGRNIVSSGLVLDTMDVL